MARLVWVPLIAVRNYNLKKTLYCKFGTFTQKFIYFPKFNENNRKIYFTFGDMMIF